MFGVTGNHSPFDVMVAFWTRFLCGIILFLMEDDLYCFALFGFTAFIAVNTEANIVKNTILPFLQISLLSLL